MPLDLTDDSWKNSIATAKRVGYVPAAFSQTIRILLQDYARPGAELRAATKYQIARVFRGPSFKASLYFLSKDFAEEFLTTQDAVIVGDLVSLYGPLDLASLITCCYLRRRTAKIVDPETWKQVEPHLLLEASFGSQVGVAIPTVGLAPGLLITTLRNISHAYMAYDAPEKYREYRAALTKGNLVQDLMLELKLFGTTSAQVSSMLLTQVGFKAEMGELVVAAATTTQLASQITNPQTLKFRLAALWSEAFIKGNKQPAEKLETKYFPFESDLIRVEKQLAKIRAGQKSWLNRDKEDLTAAEAPHLFKKVASDPNLEIPDQLKDVFSLAELTAMEEMAFDDLIDQIDAEQESGKKRADVIAPKDLEEFEKALT